MDKGIKYVNPKKYRGTDSEWYQRQRRFNLAICERVKELRIAAGESQVSLALKVGVTPRVIGHYESSRCQPSLYFLLRLAKVLGVNFAQIITPVIANSYKLVGRGGAE